MSRASELSNGADEEAAVIAGVVKEEVVGKACEVVANTNVSEAMDVIGCFDQETMIKGRVA